MGELSIANISTLFILSVACSGKLATSVAQPPARLDCPCASAVAPIGPPRVSVTHSDAGALAAAPARDAFATVRDSPVFHLAVDGAELYFSRLGRGWVLEGMQGFARYEKGTWHFQCYPSTAYHVTGEFPDRVWLTTLQTWSACPDEPKLYRKRGNKFVFSRFIDGHEMLVAPWVQGSSIAAFVPNRSGPPWGYQLVVLEGNLPAPIPTRPPRRSTGPDASKCYTRLEYPTQLFAFPTGELFVVGATDCTGATDGTTYSGAVIERWSRGHQRGTFERLPIVGLDGNALSVGARSPDDIYIAGVLPDTTTPALVHFDGDGWSLRVNGLPGPMGSFAFEKPDLETGDSGAIWFIADGKLWRWASFFDDPESVPLPEGAEQPGAVWVDGQDLWLLCTNGVYTTAETKGIWKMPEVGDCNLELGGVPQSKGERGCGSKEHQSIHNFEGF